MVSYLCRSHYSDGDDDLEKGREELYRKLIGARFPLESFLAELPKVVCREFPEQPSL